MKRPLRVKNERIAFYHAKVGRLKENRGETLLPVHDHLVQKGKSGPKVSPILCIEAQDTLELTIQTLHPLSFKGLGNKCLFQANFLH